MKCYSPSLINFMGTGKYIYVPCGKCAWCRKKLRDEWVFRLRQEKKLHQFSRFLTFTYRDENLPLSIDEHTGEMVPTVRKEDLHKFHKSLWNDGFNFRYFVCSEYGSKDNRPHYHGVYFSDEKIPYKKYWDYGDQVVDLPAKDSSFKYILKYTLKGSWVPEGAMPNFRLMSRRPGIGSNFHFFYKGQEYLLDNGNVKLAVPRYYSRNYINSLNKKLESLGKPKLSNESKIDFLADHDPHEQLYAEFIKLKIPDMSFEDWLKNIYKIDYLKQCEINKKSNK